MLCTRPLLAFALTLCLAACTGGSDKPDPEPTEPVDTVEEPTPDPEPQPDPDPEPQPEPEPEPQAKSWLQPYRGLALVGKEAERAAINCSAVNAEASLAENRTNCIQQLLQQAEPGQVILVMDHPVGQACKTCVTMLAQTFEPINAGDHPPILFKDVDAGTVECTAGGKDQTLEESRKECYETLANQAGRIRAKVVLPLAIEEGEPCKSCMAIAGQGYTAKVPSN